MLCLKKKCSNGVQLLKCKNKQRRTSSIMTFSESNLINNSLVELKDDFSGLEFPIAEENVISSENNIQIITKIFKISTQNHGYSRVVKVYEVKVGDQVIKITDMFTNLPKEMNDAYNEMVQAQNQEYPEQLDFKIVLRDIENNPVIDRSYSELEGKEIIQTQQNIQTKNTLIENNISLNSQPLFLSQGTPSFDDTVIVPEEIRPTMKANTDKNGEKKNDRIFSVAKKTIKKEKSRKLMTMKNPEVNIYDKIIIY